MQKRLTRPTGTHSMSFYARLILIVATISIASCADFGPNPYEKHYQTYIDTSFADKDLMLLAPGAEPQVVFTSPERWLDTKRMILSENRFEAGQSSFSAGDLNGEKSKTDLLAQAKKVGATVVMVARDNGNTTTQTSSVYVPSTETTTSSGSVYSGSSTAYYNGTSTTSGGSLVPVTSQVTRHNYSAIFFVDSRIKWRLGIWVIDLTPETQKLNGRNTGALVDVVYKGFPAYMANVMPDDVVIEFNGAPVVDAESFEKLGAKLSTDATSVEMKVLRNGKEKTFTFNVGKREG